MIRRLYQKVRPYLWLTPGFLLWASYPPMGEVCDVFFALAPLIWLSRTATVRMTVRRWFLNGFLFWIATLYWMPAIVKNGGPWPLVVLGWFALAAYCSLFFAAYGWLSATYWHHVGRRSAVGRVCGVLLVEPVLWCGLELLRSRLFGGFAWNQLGVVSVACGFGAPARLGGVYLCSAVVFLVNGSIAGILERMYASLRNWFERKPSDSASTRWRTFETLAIFLVVWGIYAASRPGRDADGSRSESLTVGLVQRNFPCVFRAQEEDPLSVYRSLAGQLSHAKPDLVVLSESALCEFGAVDSPSARAFAADLLSITGARGMLAGGGRSADGCEYNSAALYTPPSPVDARRLAGLAGVYDKVHLVPFGEYIPGDKFVPALQKLAPVGSCTPGVCRLVELSGAEGRSDVRLGVAICFEDTDSALMRKFASKGANALVFITNDSWFSYSIESVQHAWQATARAIETGLPVVRVGNSGVSGTIDPNGRTSWLIGPDGAPLVDARGAMCDRIVLGNGTTPYVKYGDVPLFSFFLLLITTLFMIKYTHRYE